MRKLTTVFELSPKVEECLRRIFLSFLNVLHLVDALYHLEASGSTPLLLENMIYQSIIGRLRQGATLLRGKERQRFSEQIEKIAGGIEDVSTVTIYNDDREYVCLILGKIISPENKNAPLWAGAVGMVNNRFKEEIEHFERKIPHIFERISATEHTNESVPSLKPSSLLCLDGLAFAGELNARHKPICIFFSGKKTHSLASLPNMAVFINLYSARYCAISREIGIRYIRDFKLIEDLDDNMLSLILLLWLRGHDFGHFLGIDNLARELGESNPYYQALHELKSDVLALYFLRHLKSDLLKGELLTKAYAVALAEMFRYIRRDEPHLHPDSISALLAYRYFSRSGTVRLEPQSKKIAVRFDSLERDIDEILHEVISIFARGDTLKAKAFVNRLVDLDGLRYETELQELKFLKDTDIPYYIDFKLNLRDS